ncbi:TonB family protein [Paraburkholderia madseniana]|jgi:protein TonB|uniref:TonB family protein n=1 Tax=Paraburkholderia madseniana TaxID=2599607 RepID=A0A6N6WMW5_9BURK|nr:TonB family protein [Paraburkholderia madseniana]NPT67285.1 TonB family protein [Paraburkholderia madseniana]
MRLADTVDDSPRIRIALAVLVALVVWIGFLFQLGQWLGTTPSVHAPDKPLEMRVVELDPPNVPVANPSAAPATHAMPAPIAPAKPRQAADPHSHVSAQARTTTPAPSKPDVRSVHSVAPAQSTPAAEEPKVANEPPARAAGPSAEEKANATPSATSSAEATAHAIAQPLPELPDDLRDQAYQTVATARFAIHVDGSVDVELVKPTANPRLNQILLETLRRWRFFPAMQAGHPVESRQDIRVHFNVN